MPHCGIISQEAENANTDAWITDEVSSVAEVSQVRLHYTFHLLLSQVVKRLFECCGCQEHSAAACNTAKSANSATERWDNE